MLNQLLLAASGLDCNMESLISDLQHRYSAAAAAAAASSAVSQAMLFQAMSNHHHQQQQSRQPLLIATPPRPSAPSQPIVHLQEHSTIPATSQQPRGQNNNRVPSSVSQSSRTKTTINECAPLDLSVKQTTRPTNNQSTTRARSTCNYQSNHRRQALPLDLVKTETQASHKQDNPQLDLNNNNTTNFQPQTKLISSSTSPTTDDDSTVINRISAASSSSRISSSSPCAGVDNEPDGPREGSGLATVATDVISSTNGRRLRRRTVKKQKKPRCHMCNHCGRSFSRSDMLTRHSRLHSGLKPYQCGKCFQVFSRSDHLSTHERTHTGEKPYQCGICAYSACRRDMITRHMRTHSGQRIKPRTRKTSHSTTTVGNSIGIIDSRRRIKREKKLAR